MIYAINKRTNEHRLAYENEAHGAMQAFGKIPDDTESHAFVQADAEGWIPGPFGDCPLPRGAPHEVRFDDGRVVSDNDPHSWCWSHDSARRIVAYRPILDTKTETPAWDGEGMPPVGCECNVRGSPTGSMCPAVIDYIDDKHCIWHWQGGRGETIYNRVSHMEFLPIRSDEDRAVEAIKNAMEGFSCEDTQQDRAEFVYDTIRAGKVPGVKLEDK